jgi:excisionase family DNA binding protein
MTKDADFTSVKPRVERARQLADLRAEALEELEIVGYISLLKLSHALLVSYPTVNRMRKKQQINGVQVGGVYRIPKDEVERLLRYGTHSPGRSVTRVADAAMEAADDAHLTRAVHAEEAATPHTGGRGGGGSGSRHEGSGAETDPEPDPDSDKPVVLDPIPLEDPEPEQSLEFARMLRTAVPKLPNL